MTALVGVAVWWRQFGGAGGAVDAPVLAAFISGEASGTDRLAMAAGAAGIVIGGRRILRPAPPGPRATCAEERARVADIIARSGRYTSHLALQQEVAQPTDRGPYGDERSEKPVRKSAAPSSFLTPRRLSIS